MALSLLEQRIESLELRAPLAFPWGIAELPPSMELLAEEYGDDGVALAFRNLRRSHTWAGYATRLQRLEFRICERPSAREEEDLGCEAGREPSPRLSRRGSWVEDGDVVLGKWAEQPGSVCGDAESTCCSSMSRRSSWTSSMDWEEAGLSRRSSLSSCSSATPISLAAGLLQAGEQQAASAGAGVRGRGARRGNRRRVVTTYMVQNLSRSTTRHRFLDSLRALGFEGRYDYVHVPTSFQTGKSQGFAFVNFVSEEVAQEFAGHFLASDGTRPSDRFWRVAPAEVQGFKANSAAANRGKLARVRSLAHRPLILPNGQPLPDEA